MSEIDDREFGEPPLVYGKDGQSRIPEDIWGTACKIVQSFRNIEEQDKMPIDADDFLRTMIATVLLQERQGWGRRQ